MYLCASIEFYDKKEFSFGTGYRTYWKAAYAVCNSCNYSHDRFFVIQHG